MRVSDRRSGGVASRQGRIVEPRRGLCVGAHGTRVSHTWVRMEQEALDRLARVAKMALDGGVAERQIKIVERTGAKIAAALDEAIAPLGLPPAEQSATVQRFVRALTVLEQTEDDAD